MPANLLKQHCGVLVLAVLAAVIIYLPQYWLERDAGVNFHGINFTANDSEMYYNARIQDVYDGHYSAANAFLSEYKNLPYIQPPLPEIIIATLGQLSFQSRDMGKIFVATRVFMPFLLTLAIYIFVYRLTRSRLQGLVAAAAIIFGLEILQNWKRLFSALTLNFPTNEPLGFGRPVSPQMGLLFFFVYCSLFWEWLKRGKIKFLYAAGVVLGLSFYVYFYTWAFILASNGLLGLVFLFQRKFVLVKQLSAAHVIALLVASPYFYNLYQFFKISNSDFLAFHTGQFFSRKFYMSWTAVAGILLLFYTRKKDSRRFLWFACMLVGGFISLNQQLITGRELTPAHFHWYYITVMGGLIVIFTFYELLVQFFKFRWPTRSIGAAILIFLIIFGFSKQANSYSYYKSGYLLEQRFGLLYDWLNTNTPKDSVVLVPNRIRADELAAYTHNNVYYSSSIFLSDTPTERLLDMHYLRVRLLGVSADGAEQFFRSNPNIVADFLGGFSTRKTYGCRTCFPDEEYARAAQIYKQYLARDLFVELSKYRLDYIVVDKSADWFKPETVGGTTPLVKIGEFEIYRFQKQ